MNGRKKPQGVKNHIKPIDDIVFAFGDPVTGPFGNLLHYNSITALVTFADKIVEPFLLTCTAVKDGETLTSEAPIPHADPDEVIHSDPVVGTFAPGDTLMLTVTAWAPGHGATSVSRPVLVPYMILPYESIPKMLEEKKAAAVKIIHVAPHFHSPQGGKFSARTDVIYSEKISAAVLKSVYIVGNKRFIPGSTPTAINGKRQKGQDVSITAKENDKVFVTTWAEIKVGNDIVIIDGGTVELSVTDTGP